LCEFAGSIVDRRVKMIMELARERGSSSLLRPIHVLLITTEIGQDMANDLSSIYLVRETERGTSRIPIVENQRIFWEHGIALAAAYALKNDIDHLLYERDRSYVWE